MGGAYGNPTELLRAGDGRFGHTRSASFTEASDTARPDLDNVAQRRSETAWSLGRRVKGDDVGAVAFRNGISWDGMRFRDP